MSIGSYGIVRAADVTTDDIDVFYTYSPNRETISTTVTRLDAASVLTELKIPDDEQIVNEENLLEGLFNFKLPADTFNSIGVYNIYIKPKAIKSTIVDCGVLAALPNIKGILLDATGLDDKLVATNGLQGYRIEYLNDDGNKIRNTYRIVTTSNRAVPVTDNVGNTSQNATRYRFDDSGSLIFLQVTPSSSSNVKPNVIPFIGVPNQEIIVSNTFFNPVTFEVELVENTIDTVMDFVSGEQLKDSDNGILTYYNKNREIIKQFNVFQVNSDLNTPLYEVKELRTDIDQSQNIDDVINSLNL
jgi:hypothetical protein